MDFMLLQLKDDSEYPPVSIDDGPPASILHDYLEYLHDYLDDGSNVTAIGWGTTCSGLDAIGVPISPRSRVLKEVELNVVGNIECNSTYSGGVTDNMICAASPGITCLFESGGPLIIRGGSHSDDVLVGVFSGLTRGWQPSHPGVCSRVTKAYKWITEILTPTCSDIKGKFNLNAGLYPNKPQKEFLRDCLWIGRKATRKAKQCKSNKVFKKCLCTCLPTVPSSLNEID